MKLKSKVLVVLLDGLMLSIIANILYFFLQFTLNVDVAMFYALLVVVCLVPIIKFLLSSKFRNSIDGNLRYLFIEIVEIILVYVVIFLVVFLTAGSQM